MDLDSDAARRLGTHLLDEYGDRAEDQAAERAEALDALGRNEAASVWAAVRLWIAGFRAPAPGEPSRPDDEGRQRLAGE